MAKTKLKLSDENLGSEMLKVLNEDMKEVYNDLKQSLEGTDINTNELIIKWYNNPDLLKKYIENSKGTEGIELLVTELRDFIVENYLDVQLDTVMEELTEKIAKKADSCIVQTGEITASDAQGKE